MKPAAAIFFALLLGISIYGVVALLSSGEPDDATLKPPGEQASRGYELDVSITFVNGGNEEIKHSTSFTHSNPIVTVGIGEELRDIKRSDLNVDLNAGTVTVHIHGTVTCDIADVVPDRSADITHVLLHGAVTLDKDGRPSRQIAVTNKSPYSLERDYRPQKTDTFPPRPYIGKFECDLVFPLESGHHVGVMAVNAIGQDGSDSFFVNLNFNRNEGKENIDAPAKITIDVTNNEGTDAGICNPIWVYIVDPTITPENVATRQVRFFNGHSFDLIIDSDGRVRTKVPFIQVGRDFIFGKMPHNIINVETNGASQDAIYKHVTESIEFSYT